MLDEAALLLELEDVYWSAEGLLSVQISLAMAALMGAVTLGVRFIRRGERIALDSGDQPTLTVLPAASDAGKTDAA